MYTLSNVSVAENPQLEREILAYLSEIKAAHFIGDICAVIFIRKTKPAGFDPYFAADCFLRSMVALKRQQDPELLIQLAWKAYYRFFPIQPNKKAIESFLSEFNRFYCEEFRPCMFFMLRNDKVVATAFGNKDLLAFLKQSHYDNPLIYKPNAFLVCDHKRKLDRALEHISALQARYRELRVPNFELATSEIRKYAQKKHDKIFAIIGKGSTYRDDCFLTHLSDMDISIICDGYLDIKALSKEVLVPISTAQALFFSPRLLDIASVRGALAKGDAKGITDRLVGSYLFVSNEFIPLIRAAESLVPGLAWDRKHHVLRYKRP